MLLLQPLKPPFIAKIDLCWQDELKRPVHWPSVSVGTSHNRQTSNPLKHSWLDSSQVEGKNSTRLTTLPQRLLMSSMHTALLTLTTKLHQWKQPKSSKDSSTFQNCGFSRYWTHFVLLLLHHAMGLGVSVFSQPLTRVYFTDPLPPHLYCPSTVEVCLCSQIALFSFNLFGKQLFQYVILTFTRFVTLSYQLG